ncbi:MAG: transcription elongation factor GreA [bacterium]|nr:transcription elongation factor GreA [bacterium]MDZ4231393.1 transcription elongation factor GreA [Patescibacteria group bacterium]
MEYLTKEKFDEFSAELERLKTEGRKEVTESLKIAKELGDLSENAQYIEAREEQQRIERRIAELEQMLKEAEIISTRSKKRDAVEVGATVEVVRDGKTSKFYIVGSSEANPVEGFISNESPLGRVLIDKRVGDMVELKTPEGKTQYKVKSIS